MPYKEIDVNEEIDKMLENDPELKDMYNQTLHEYRIKKTKILKKSLISKYNFLLHYHISS